MREILFRGKIIEPCHYCGQWLEGFYGVDDGKTFIAIQQKNGLNGFFCDPKTVGQYTGLKDVHGKRVFEADILSIKCADEKSRPYPVYFGTYNVDGFGNDFHIGFYTKHFGEDISLGFLADSNGPTDFEVIGNIFDNPELLEGEQ